MPKTRKQKEELLDELTTEFVEQKATVFTNYEGLTVEEIDELRNELREAGVIFSVVKTTIAKLAMKEAGLKDVELPDVKRPLAIAFSHDDEVSAAKIIAKFAKKNKKPEILSGILEGKLLSVDEVKNLAKLLSRDELLAKFVYTIQGPVSGFVNVLAGNLRGLVGALNAIKEQKGEAK